MPQSAASPKPDRPEEEPSAAGTPEHDSFAAFREKDFCLYFAGSVIATLGAQMQTGAVLWEVYQRTERSEMLGLVGLAQFIPFFLLALPAGYLVDRVSRRWVISGALLVMACASLGLAWISHAQAPIERAFLALAATGGARVFYQTSRAAFLPQLVSGKRFVSAVTWSTGGFHLAATIGPPLGGLLIATTGAPETVYLLDALAAITFAGLLIFVRPRSVMTPAALAGWQSILTGAAFVWRTKTVLGAMSLDLFAVLLGGAINLLPVYAKDILGTNAFGMGFLQAGPPLGALLMAVILARRPPIERAGRALLLAVVGFGVATVVFGISRNIWLSFGMLFLTGALDNISVVVRHTLVQVLTPDEMRGRVSAVNSMFIGASNELGGYESGEVAEFFGPTASVVSGGLGAILVAILAAILLPDLRRYGRLGTAPGGCAEKGESGK